MSNKNPKGKGKQKEVTFIDELSEESEVESDKESDVLEEEFDALEEESNNLNEESDFNEESDDFNEENISKSAIKKKVK